MDINAIVEIPINTGIKYEFDTNKNIIKVDRILTDNMLYPGNYGFIPNTLANDGDPLDILILCNYPIYPNVMISCKIIGVLIMTDEKGLDEKIIAVPSDKVDSSSKVINNIDDISETMRNNIKYFFKSYKNSSDTEWSKVNDYKDKTYAIDIINKYSK